MKTIRTRKLIPSIMNQQKRELFMMTSLSHVFVNAANILILCYVCFEIVRTELKAWDLFRVLPLEKDRSAEESDARVNFLIKCIKVVACVVVFVVVLGTGVLAKGTVLFMATQTSKTQTVSFCNSPGFDLSECKMYLIIFALQIL